MSERKEKSIVTNAAAGLRQRAKYAAGAAAAFSLVIMPALSQPASADELVIIDEGGEGTWSDSGEISGGSGQSYVDIIEEDQTQTEWMPGNEVIPDDLIIAEDGDAGIYTEVDPAISINENVVSDTFLMMAEVMDERDYSLNAADTDQIGRWLDELEKTESPTGSDGELIVSRFISQTMKDMGYEVSEQSFHEGFINEDLRDVPGLNLIAERGADAESRTGQTLIIAVHYDSKTDPEEGDPLANDKHGVAAALELARLCMEMETSSNICFLFLSGQEDGGYGAKAFVEHLSEELRYSIAGFIYLDTVGYEMPYQLAVPYGSPTTAGERLAAAASIRAERRAEYEAVIADSQDGMSEAQEQSGTAENTADGSSLKSGNGEIEIQIEEWAFTGEESGRMDALFDQGFEVTRIFQVFPETEEIEESSEEADEITTEADLDEIALNWLNSVKGETGDGSLSPKEQETENRPLSPAEDRAKELRRIADITDIVGDVLFSYMRQG